MPRNNESSRAAAHKFTLLKRALSASGVELTEEAFDRYIPSKIANNPRTKSLALNLLIQTSKQTATKALIGKMVQLGLPKPEWISLEEWESKYPLLPSEKLICHLAASGLDAEEIAKEAQIPHTEVRTILTFDRAQKCIDEIRTKDFGADPKRMFERIAKYLPEAIETAYEIMMDKEQKGSTRLAAAESFMDRILGKATQKIEVEDSTIKDVLQRIDQMAQEEKKKIVEQNTIEMKKEESCADKVDSWVAANPL